MHSTFYGFIHPPDDCHKRLLKHAAVNIMNTQYVIHSVLLLRHCSRHACRRHNVTTLQCTL
jgi:hypothetical protein